MEVLTLGHSLRPLEEVGDILRSNRIAYVVDVRRFPGERKCPGYGREILERTCLQLGMSYVSLAQTLGGARSGGYRAHMETEPFREGMAELMELVRRKRTVLLCREALYFRCHRKYIADDLVRGGWSVTHLLDADRRFKHRAGSFRMSAGPDTCG